MVSISVFFIAGDRDSIEYGRATSLELKASSTESGSKGLVISVWLVPISFVS